MGNKIKMAEWSIHVVCCDVIVEDGWPFTAVATQCYVPVIATH